MRPRRLRRPAPAAQPGDRRDYISRNPSARPHSRSPRPWEPNAAPSTSPPRRPARATRLPAPSADCVPRDSPTPATAAAAPPPPGRRARLSVGGAPGLRAGVGPVGLRSGPLPPRPTWRLSSALSCPDHGDAAARPAREAPFDRPVGHCPRRASWCLFSALRGEHPPPLPPCPAGPWAWGDCWAACRCCRPREPAPAQLFGLCLLCRRRPRRRRARLPAPPDWLAGVTWSRSAGPAGGGGPTGLLLQPAESTWSSVSGSAACLPLAGGRIGVLLHPPFSALVPSR